MYLKFSHLKKLNVGLRPEKLGTSSNFAQIYAASVIFHKLCQKVTLPVVNSKIDAQRALTSLQMTFILIYFEKLVTTIKFNIFVAAI